jgi:hypothetical protein
MENDPRSHTKRLCSCDLVWFRGSFLCNLQEHTKRNSDTTRDSSPLWVYRAIDYYGQVQIVVVIKPKTAVTCQTRFHLNGALWRP